MENANSLTMLKWHFDSLESIFFLSITSSNNISIVFFIEIFDQING